MNNNSEALSQSMCNNDKWPKDRRGSPSRFIARKNLSSKNMYILKFLPAINLEGAPRLSFGYKISIPVSRHPLLK